ncbi:M48 family metallopeptidase [Endozoicomonas sp. G2_2]|uniref:M48 family metallopeptidase n=1 Tax=Endozoicomonas sp. G2_2 TaxID=2821092 RepID=UPI001ADBBB02|nr:M48 family metallopeptidase [Endozoicomonas sp. G2_2]MBO9470078.1 M48 family metallopeptidase [Endozoicomonas sp. G2_2]
MHRLITPALILLVLVGCATSPTGRNQLKLFSEQRLAEMGAQSFQEMKSQTPVANGSSVNNYVGCVADAITDVTGGTWEVVVFNSDQVNAFALPGGKIGVYSGLLDVAQTDDQLATVIAHEVGHVLAEHGNERVSQQAATQGGLQVVSAFLGGSGGGAGSQAVMSALGLGAQVGILLPFSRAQESEADTVGLELMARAGFDPRESVALWQNMAAAGGEKPAEFMSTHPSNETRINNLQSHMNQAMQLYQQAPNKTNCS